jgi:hypothetical protein
MTAAEIADGLLACVRAGDYAGAMDRYYHPEIVSIEAAGEPREMVGVEACRQKVEWWNQSFQVHETRLEGPFLAGDRFAIRYTYDLTNKGTGQRTTMDEMALYWVEAGKVVREQFFYHAPGM